MRGELDASHLRNRRRAAETDHSRSCSVGPSHQMEAIMINLNEVVRLDKLAAERYSAYRIKGTHVVAATSGYLLLAGGITAIYRTGVRLEQIIREF
jgi:hypothetical protein